MRNNTTAEKVVSRDAIRFSLVKEDEEYFSKEDEVFKIFISTIKEKLISLNEVYVDATHLNPPSRSKLISALGTSLMGVELNVIWVKVPLEVALKRNEQRKNTRAYVPRGVIRRMHSQLRAPEYEEGFDNIFIV